MRLEILRLSGANRGALAYTSPRIWLRGGMRRPLGEATIPGLHDEFLQNARRIENPRWFCCTKGLACEVSLQIIPSRWKFRVRETVEW